MLLIVVDTLRADRLGTYGYGKPTSPVLDAFAEQSLVFEQAVSPAPFTMPAMAAMLTGRYPDKTGVVNHEREFILDCPVPTLAERFKTNGYSTSAVVSNAWLAATAMRFNRGFDEYITRSNEGKPKRAKLNANTVTTRALERMDTFKDGPSFLWVHYIDAHMPYQPPKELSALFGNPTGKSSIVETFRKGRVSPQVIFFAQDHDHEAVEATRALYDGEIRKVDTEIGRLLNGLRERGLEDKTTVIVVSDHGEALGDHGLYFAHDFTLYDELVRVPLMVRHPDIEPARIATEVTPMDIAPTLCAWQRLNCREEFDGRALPRFVSKGSTERTIFAAAAPARRRYSANPRIFIDGLHGRWTMARTRTRKLIKIPHPDGPIWEGYDLAADPREEHNLLVDTNSGGAQSAQAFAQLRRRLTTWEKEMVRLRHVPTPLAKTIDQKTQKRLEALGYLN